MRWWAVSSFSEKRNITIWRPSVCLSRRHTHHDSAGNSMRRGQRTFRPNNKEDRHTCSIFEVSLATRRS